MTLQYKGLNLPNPLFDPRSIGDNFDEVKAGDWLKAQVHYLQGIDLALGAPTPASDLVRESAYRYFHDDDDPGSRYYRRVKRGAIESMEDLFSELNPDRLWHPSYHSVTLEDLEHYWVEVPYEELPDEAQDHDKYERNN